MQEPLISIIVPIFKVEQYLRKCIDSIIEQTYSNLEIILVDDGSPDNCGLICDEYATKDIRIIVIHKENGGLSDARNGGIDIAKGEYITFIDSDDYVDINYIEVLYDLTQKFDASLSVSSFSHFKEEGGEIEKDKGRVITNVLSANEAIETMFYQDKFETSAWGKLYKKELFGHDIRYPKGMLYEDLPTTYKLMLKAVRIAYTTQRTYHYLLRGDSIQCSAFNPKKMDILKVADMIIPDIRNNHPELYESLKCRLFCAYMNIFLQTEKDSAYQEILWKEIKGYRWGILKDRNARKKAIIAALISILGQSAVRYCFSLINIRN